MTRIETSEAPRRRFLPLALLFGALLWLAALPPALADETPLTEEEEERLEAIERHTEKGLKAFRTGNHEEVLARMKRLKRYDPDNALAPYLIGRVQERTGAYEDALKSVTEATGKHPDDRRLEALRFSLLLTTGEHQVAGTAARAALETNPSNMVARCVLAQTLEERGRRKEALAEYDKVVAQYNKMIRGGEEVESDDTALPYVAHAAIRATWLSPNASDDMLNPAVRLLGKYLKQDPDDFDVKYQLAEVYRSDRGPKGQSRARKHYTEILKANSEFADARVGIARTDLVFYQQSKALEGLKRALVTNPNHVPALALTAAINTSNGDYVAARKALDQALKINPTHKEARAVKAALLYIRGDTAGFAALERELLAYDPSYGELYRICAELVGERKRRYDLAKQLAEKAIAVDANDRDAYTVLGESLMNLGETDEALEVFRKGRVASKKYKDVRRDNWIEVLTEALPSFKTLKSENFIVRMPISEARVMEPYLLPLLEEAYDTLSKKYGFTPVSPTYADSFDRQDDFSVRSVGTAGLPALGVCFGRVITLLGPTAVPVGQFSWSRTAWHEFAHVMTLQLSKGQVPRWLTEGLSVYEEKSRRERWGREMEKQLYDRWHNGRLLKMSEINSAFRGPDILFAYFQGGLISEHLQQERGFEVIPQMLRKFAEDKSTKDVFKEVLNLDLDKYDEMFHAYVGSIVGGYKMVPIWDKESMEAFEVRVKRNPNDIEAHVRLAWGHFQRNNEIDAGGALEKAVKLDEDHPEVRLLLGAIAQKNRRADLAERHYSKVIDDGHDDLRARLFLAERALTQGGDSEVAIKHLEAAKTCFPRYVAKDNPYLQLARLYRGGGDLKKAMEELEAYAKIAAEDYGVRKELKAWYKRNKDTEAIVRVCEEMVDVTPFGANVKRGEMPDMELHRDYAEALLELGRLEEALRERTVQVELGRLLKEEQQIEAGVIDDRLKLGNMLLDLDRAEDALEQAFAILRLDPTHAGGLMLKQRAMEADAGR